MRRATILVVILFSLVLLPGSARAHSCSPDWAVALTLGFMIPFVINTAVEAATAPYDSYSYYEPPPPPPDPPPPPRVPPRPIAASDHATGTPARTRVVAVKEKPVLGEIVPPAASDPARAEAMSLLRQGRYFQAAESLRALALRRPSDPEIALRFSESLLGSRNYRYAEYVLRGALQGPLPGLRPLSPAPLLASHLSALEKRLQGEKTAWRGRLLAAYWSLALGDASRSTAHLKVLLAQKPGDRCALWLREEIRLLAK